MIVDDEPLARERLRRMIETFPGYAVVGEAAEGRVAVERAAELAPDAVLLDVHMPGVDGLQVARELAGADLPPAVIFITAHSEHALSAHNSQADGYLLKPVRRDDLAAALVRARQPSRAQYAALAGHSDDGGPVGYVSARTRDGIERVAIRDILYFWADQKYTSVFHLHGELLIEQSLATLEQSLSKSFMRVHRKALVARAQVTGLKYNSDGSACLTLRHVRTTVPVSRRRLTEVRALLDS
ncbi:LytTR family DNA-binding domain-containing protein [Salinisphaera sp.]|uniref:LytR/AlgR family response regulator transcription factor n=1 Tax=Salinisphaera sp. TaxID=1914330 RepID=UPI002D778E27|nr:LytTR family DNA-binding domain-containing protein [Salinisphaera sp.]HET7315402.1 LytTR family DNA-binding domain-containing protein [Salinisphaera sp.]